MADELGKSPRQVMRDISSLENHKLIERVRRGNRQANVYRFLWHQIFESDATPTSHQKPGSDVTSMSYQDQSSDVTDLSSDATSTSPSDVTSTSHELCNLNCVPGITAPNERIAAAPSATAADVPADSGGVRAATRRRWTKRQRAAVSRAMAGFMDGEAPPENLIAWVESLSVDPDSVIAALAAAWSRQAEPGKKSAPRTWNWFYEVLRNSLIEGYSARHPEKGAAEPSKFDLSAGISAIELPDAYDKSGEAA